MSPSPAAGCHIAVVEDDGAVLGSLQFALEAQGYRVSLFATAQDAIDSPEIVGTNCLVIDYALPDIDGLTMLSKLRRRGLTCPAIIIASNPTARCRAEAEKAGAPLVEKPIMAEALNDLLLKALDGSASPASTDGV